MQRSHSLLTSPVKRALLIFSQPGEREERFQHLQRETQPKCYRFQAQCNQVLYQTKCVYGWEVRKPFGTWLKAGNPSWVNKSSPWGTVFPGTLCDVWMWTQTSLHYVATALEPLVLGERPCHWQPWPAGGCRRLPLCYVFFSLFTPPGSDPFLHTPLSL